MILYTIGFTKKSAERFFKLLRDNRVSQLLDVRINNTSQLAGFAKGRDLEFFVGQLCGIPYRHAVEYAPTKELLDQWHKHEISWEEYEQIYRSLLDQRSVQQSIDVTKLDHACLLCSEETPEHCHRRLLAEYLKNHSDVNIDIIHLV